MPDLTILAIVDTYKVLDNSRRFSMSMKATSVRLDDETLERVGRMAEAMDRPRAWLMAHAIKKFIEQEEWFIREVELGIEAADGGRLTEHADVKAKWEAKRAAAMD